MRPLVALATAVAALAVAALAVAGYSFFVESGSHGSVDAMRSNADTEPATDVAGTTATLHAEVDWDQGDDVAYWWEYRRVGASDWTRTTKRDTVPLSRRRREVLLDQTVSGLTPGAVYEFRFCGYMTTPKQVGSDQSPVCLASNRTATPGEYDRFSTLERDVGIWFSTWYYQHRVALLSRGYGVGSSKQMLGDVNGDGKADSIVYFGVSGSWYAALSDGTVFGGGTQWIIDHGIGPDNHFLADVNGDHKADAIAFLNGPGIWYVALSDGNSFGGWSQWISGHGAGTANQMMGDVNGDGRDDAVVYDNGNWYAALSQGSSFGPGWGQWSSGHGVGSTNQMLGDVNGDGRDDAVAFFRDGRLGGDWFVSLSNGGTFGPGDVQWSSGHGIDSDHQWLTDINGDNRDDAVVAFKNSATVGGNWYAASSSGGGFGDASPWKKNLGRGSSWMAVGDVDGDDKSDPVSFSAGDGTWRYVPAPYDDYNTMSLWNEWGMQYQPVVNGSARQYDSGDPAVIRYQLRQIASAGINFLLFDLTNNIETQPILANAQAVCKEARSLDATEGLNLKVAVALGPTQFSPEQPELIEREAGQIKRFFLENPDCGPSTYYHVNGKPLLVMHAGRHEQRIAWQNLPDHRNSSQFTVRFSQGVVPQTDEGSYPSRNPNGGCGTIPPTTTPPRSDLGLYMGWGMPKGSLPVNAGIATVMPGWNNHRGQFVSRTQYNSPGGFYTTCGWDRVLNASPKPSMVVINSYNEFAEETAVEPANTDLVGGQPPTERWPSPDYYWNITTQKVAQYKAAP